MSLLDDLRAASHHIPPSHVPTGAELTGIVAALIVAQEHGADSLHEAVSGDDPLAVNKLLDPEAENDQRLAETSTQPAPPVVTDPTAPAPQPGAGQPAPAATPAASGESQDNAALVAEVQSLRAQLAEKERGTVTVSETQPAAPGPADSSPGAATSEP